jgi:hypothetical protein
MAPRPKRLMKCQSSLQSRYVNDSYSTAAEGNSKSAHISLTRCKEFHNLGKGLHEHVSTTFLFFSHVRK